MTAIRSQHRTAIVRGLASAALAFLGWACASPAVDAPLATPGGVSAARVTSGPSVASTNPSYGDRGTTLDVHVIGSGFTTGAQATWLLRGVADPTKVRTNSTTYVSSTEVIANITIASDADLAYWDVQIALAGGKNGVGTECFEVSTAVALGPATFVTSMNDLGQIVGTGTGAFVYDDSFGMLTLGAGQGGGVDPLGTMVLGRDGSNAVTAWVRQGSTSTYVAELLPALSGSIGGNAVSAARDAAGTLLVGGWQIMPATKKGGSTQNRPAMWRHDVTWSAPTILALPAGSTTGAVRGINGNGQAVGRLDASDRGAVWENPATVTPLDGLPDGINAAGTIVVGARAGQPVYWYRTTTGAWNTTGVPLPSIAGTCGGVAHTINTDGVIVGKSCNANGVLQATVWRLDVSAATPIFLAGPQALSGLGVKKGTTSESSDAVGVTSVAPYVIAGTAAGLSGSMAVRWRTW